MTSAADKIKGRQLEILQRLANGDKRAVIASDLGIAPDTLNQYCKRLYARLGAHTAAQALAVYLRQRHPTLALF